jgi:hypothetical protein
MRAIDRLSAGMRDLESWLAANWPAVNGSEPPAPIHAPVAQLDRALAYEARGRVFESPRAYHSSHAFQRIDAKSGNGSKGEYLLGTT